MPAKARVFLVSPKGLLEVGQRELEELRHKVVLNAYTFDEALEKALMIEEMTVNVAVLDADQLSQHQAEELVARIKMILPQTIIISWSTTQNEFPWAKYWARKANATGKVPSLAMYVSVAS